MSAAGNYEGNVTWIWNILLNHYYAASEGYVHRDGQVVLPEVLAAPLVPGVVIQGPPPLPAGTPRDQWVAARPAPRAVEDWANAQFVDLSAPLPGFLAGGRYTVSERDEMSAVERQRVISHSLEGTPTGPSFDQYSVSLQESTSKKPEKRDGESYEEYKVRLLDNANKSKEGIRKYYMKQA